MRISDVMNKGTHMNSRDEMGDVCLHRRRFLLKNVKSDKIILNEREKKRKKEMKQGRLRKHKNQN